MAAVNTQFSIAIHLLAGLGYGRDGLSSAHLADSVNANASFVRRILAKLSKANLVHTSTGKGGACSLAKSPSDITLLDIYEAVEAPKAFAIHAYPAEHSCKVSCNIKHAMEKALGKTQKAMESGLEQITLAEVISDMKKEKG